MEEISLNLGKPNLNVSSDTDGGTIKINIDNSTPKKVLILVQEQKC